MQKTGTKPTPTAAIERHFTVPELSKLLNLDPRAVRRRDVPMGYLTADLKLLCKGDPERFVFQIETHPAWGKKTAICRDDRDLNQHFLRPAAKELGFYWKGFGWHALRREAVTAFNAALGVTQTMKMSGHGTVDMSAHYTLADQVAQDGAVRARQESIMGKTGEKVN